MTDAAWLGGGPALLSEESVLEVVRQFVGTRASVRRWYVRTDTYVVASVASTDRFIVKLELPGRRPNRRFDVTAAVGRRVRKETTVPTFDVVAVDVSRRRWPWNVLIVTELAGEAWAHVYPRLDEVQRAMAQCELGQAAAQLHTLASMASASPIPTSALPGGTDQWPPWPHAPIADCGRLASATTSARYWTPTPPWSTRRLGRGSATKI